MTFIATLKGNILILMRPITRIVWPAPPSHLRPISRRWGFERGTPISRYYIDRYLEKHANDFIGDILEIKSRRYTDQHAKGPGKRDVLDIDPTNRNANVVADIARADHVPDNSYDCVVVTETLQFVYEIEDAIRHCHRILKPGGILLVSLPSISPVDDELAHLDCWRFYPCACKKLFGPIFGLENVQIESYGNFATSVANLSGVAFEEMPKDITSTVDTKYPQGILVRAKKSVPNAPQSENPTQPTTN